MQELVDAIWDSKDGKRQQEGAQMAWERLSHQIEVSKLKKVQINLCSFNLSRTEDINLLALALLVVEYKKGISKPMQIKT